MTREFHPIASRKISANQKLMVYSLMKKKQASKFQGRMPCVFQVLKKTKANIYVNMNVLGKGSGRMCSKVFTVVILKNEPLRDLGGRHSLFTLYFIHFCIVKLFSISMCCFCNVF